MNTDIQELPFNSANRAKSIGIRGRLMLGFAAMSIILLILVTASLVLITKVKNSTNNVIQIDLPAYEAMSNLAIHINQAQSILRDFVLTKNPQEKIEFDALWQNNIIPSIKTINTLKTDWTHPELIEKWNAVLPLINNFKIKQDKIINAGNTLTPENLNLLIKELNRDDEAIHTILDGAKNDVGVRSGGMFDLILTKLHTKSKLIIDNMNAVIFLEYSLAVLVIISAFAIAFFTSKGIIRHIDKFRKHSSRIAAGDLRNLITLESNDEIGQLGNDLNVMTKSLAGITKQITDACHNMVTSLDEVQHTVDMQSSGATEQAASINQITASLEEIEKSSSQTMEKAQTLGEVAERTRQKGQLGLESVEQSIAGMKAVREKVQVIAQTILNLSNQTQQVGEITGVVNTLAQQSKMLALNASIEAAKAGEAGKGFAVVASEVKNLAEQSEQSTIQVQKILENIRQATEKAVMVTEEGTKGVDQGTELVEQTGEIVRNLTDVIHEATIASQQIEAAVRQETVGLEQITAGMNEINKVTATFVESINQTTEAIGNLSLVAKNLKEHVDTYKIS